jgi:Polysaccharide biosynthesis
LDDWITHVYDRQVLGPTLQRGQLLPKWHVKHWTYGSRYEAKNVHAQWLPYEWERGRQLIYQYLATHYPKLAAQVPVSLPPPERVPSNVVQQILAVLPPQGNILVWGLNRDAHYWHAATTGTVVFLSEENGGGVFRDLFFKPHPYTMVEKIEVAAWQPDMAEASYERFAVGPSVHTDRNSWCGVLDVKLPLETTWDVILVDAPEVCSSLDACTDESGPGEISTAICFAHDCRSPVA